MAILIALTLAGYGLGLLFERHLSRSLGEDLDVHLKLMMAGIDLNADGHLTLAREPADPRFAVPYSGLYWQAGDGNDQLRSRSLWDAVLPLANDPLTPGEAHLHRLPGPQSSSLLVAERIVLLSSAGVPRAVRLAVAADTARITTARRGFDRDMAIALAVLALVLALATSAQVVLGLRPLRRLREAIAGVRTGTANRLSPDAPAEVRPLVEEVNALLDARDRDIETSRGRAADLAHGLKTPLAALMADAGRLRSEGHPRMASDIEEVVEAMTRHVDRELARARLRGNLRSGEAPKTPLAPLVRGLVATIGRTPSATHLAFELDIPDAASLPIERTDLAEALGNLLDNAARHACSKVTVSMLQDAVLIDDDGPGLPPEQRAVVVQRGVRLDQRGGAGLGLSLTQDVLEAYGWHLTLEQAPLGGLRVRLEPDQPIAKAGA